MLLRASQHLSASIPHSLNILSPPSPAMLPTSAIARRTVNAAVRFTSSLVVKKSYKILIVGGGSGGLSVANQIYSRFKAAGKSLNPRDIAVVDPAQYHYYQVGFRSHSHFILSCRHHLASSPVGHLLERGFAQKRISAAHCPRWSLLTWSCFKNRCNHFLLTRLQLPPLLDGRLITKLSSLPPASKLTGMGSKAFLKHLPIHLPGCLQSILTIPVTRCGTILNPFDLARPSSRSPLVS